MMQGRKRKQFGTGAAAAVTAVSAALSWLAGASRKKSESITVHGLPFLNTVPGGKVCFCELSSEVVVAAVVARAAAIWEVLDRLLWEGRQWYYLVLEKSDLQKWSLII